MSPLAPSTASSDPLEIEIDRFDSLEFEYHTEIKVEIKVEIKTKVEIETEIESPTPSIDDALLATARLDSSLPRSLGLSDSIDSTRDASLDDRPPSAIIHSSSRVGVPTRLLSLHIYYKKY